MKPFLDIILGIVGSSKFKKTELWLCLLFGGLIVTLTEGQTAAICLTVIAATYSFARGVSKGFAAIGKAYLIAEQRAEKRAEQTEL